jgi:hypothetical protein
VSQDESYFVSLALLTGTIELNDLQAMAQAIEEGCEKGNDAAVKLSLVISD